jgi:hypothetical protein
VWRRQVGFVRGTRWLGGSSADRVGRAGTTWEPSHEWRLAEATPSSRGFRWFTRKPLGSLVDPQSQDRRTEDGAAAAPDRSDQWV